ncbi:DUF4271 domain-containing protein [Maribacter polysaccharolyticus]|uniref:DUF4271 domain-containing protein n=1 Tax=Maribacter polysaccharolyticus TaxID=3020831 RepID=UPI00237F6F94|nr:DUF4271 domain-containing protein [Maribacter polysaccharolyticus]MDE3742994.1 DUF4271 domain-containing protein [Maribacter polysaccharolyticus]
MEAVLRNIATNDWITILVTISLLFLAVAKRYFYPRFLNFIILPFNNKYIFMYNKKEKLVNWFNLFWGMFLIINFSIFIYLILHIFSATDSVSRSLPFLWIIGAIILYLFLKLGMQLGNGYIFGVQNMITDVVFKKLSYFNYSGMIMFMANIIITYILIDSKPVVYTTIFLIIVVNLIGWVTILRNYQNLISSHFFYFILYLCALEIAPLILIGSYLKN